MKEVHLNKQLGGLLKSFCEAWQHDNPSETLAFILDAILNDWAVSPPQIPILAPEDSCRVRLKKRHLLTLEKTAGIAGITIPALVRVLLTQWALKERVVLDVPRSATPDTRSAGKYTPLGVEKVVEESPLKKARNANTAHPTPPQKKSAKDSLAKWAR